MILIVPIPLPYPLPFINLFSPQSQTQPRIQLDRSKQSGAVQQDNLKVAL